MNTHPCGVHSCHRPAWGADREYCNFHLLEFYKKEEPEVKSSNTNKFKNKIKENKTK